MTTLRLTLLLATGLGFGCIRTVLVTPPPQPEERRVASTAATLGIPPGHLPSAGECRIWIPGTPPGRQPRPRSRTCVGIAQYAPAGSWIVYRPTRDRRLVHVRVVDQRRVGQIAIVRIFEWETGRFVRDTRPEDEPQDDQPNVQRPSRDLPYPYERPQERPRENRPPIEPPRERPREEPPGPGTPGTLGIPPGHLPAPGDCRIWIPGVPPGQQRYQASSDCAGIARDAPAGSWIVYRPTRDRRLVHVRVVDERRAGTVVIVRIFEVETGRFVRDSRPEDEPRDELPNLQRPSRDEPPVLRPPDIRPREERPNPPAEKPKPPEERPRPPDEKPKPPDERPKPPDEKPKPPEERREDRPGPSKATRLDIPQGHLPEPGECRIWIPGAPPGQQRHRASSDCDGIALQAPAGSWIVYRPTQDPKLVHVRVVDERRAGVIVVVRVFEVEGGRFVREEAP